MHLFDARNSISGGSIDGRDCRRDFHHGLVIGREIMGGESGGSAEGVADEAPQHNVSLPSFALGKYDVTRGEYAAFVRGTRHSAGDGCGHNSYEWKKQAGKS